jgi:hypothetical protein
MEDKGNTHSTYIEAYKDHPFKDEQGRLLYSKLFYERCVPATRQKVRYTLKDQEHEGYPSLYQLYMESEDPTEYAFATKYFDSYNHWINLTQAEWFKEYITRFRTELETKLRSKALASIIKEARSGSKNAFLANKYLLEKGWQPKGTKGRPSKDQIQKAAEEIATEDRNLKEDYLRIVGQGN